MQGCIAEHGRSHVCGVSELSPSSTSLNVQLHARSHATVVSAPTDASHYGYGELPPPPYTYGAAASSMRHADYQHQPCYVEFDRPRCTCGDRRCAQFVGVHDVYDVGGGRQHPAVTAPPYHGHHVALPPGTTAVYPGHHRMLYPADHFQVIRPSLATHYHHHRHGYPPPPSPSSDGGAHYMPALTGDGLYAAGPRLMTAAAAAGYGEHVTSIMATSCAPFVNGDYIMKNDGAASSANITRDSMDNVEPSVSTVGGISTTSTAAEHDITPTRDTSALFASSTATTDTTQLYTYSSSSGNLFTSSHDVISR